jgi:hypothetical protein
MTDDNIKQGVQQVAQSLYEKHGRLLPSALVAAAQPRTSPAHDGFEWDNKKAGHEYRLWQARGWFRRIEIRIEPAGQPERLINVPRIVRVEAEADSREGEYQIPSVLIKRPDEFQRALDQAQGKLAAAKRAMDELYAAAERTDRNDQAAVIAQMAKATDLWASALSAMH